MVNKNDWRLSRWQEEYLFGKTLIKVDFKPFSLIWDHEHCEFCWKKFGLGQNDLHFGYCTTDLKYWICKDCFHDFKEMFQWKVKNHM